MLDGAGSIAQRSSATTAELRAPYERPIWAVRRWALRVSDYGPLSPAYSGLWSPRADYIEAD